MIKQLPVYIKDNEVECKCTKCGCKKALVLKTERKYGVYCSKCYKWLRWLKKDDWAKIKLYLNDFKI